MESINWTELNWTEPLITLRCWVWHLSRPAAAMYVLPIVLIFSTPEYLGFDNNYTDRPTSQKIKLAIHRIRSSGHRVTGLAMKQGRFMSQNCRNYFIQLCNNDTWNVDTENVYSTHVSLIHTFIGWLIKQSNEWMTHTLTKCLQMK